MKSQEESSETDSCPLVESERRREPNLCCCYVVDDRGRYSDPCAEPVDGCCC
jgi:hypothetical protein